MDSELYLDNTDYDYCGDDATYATYATYFPDNRYRLTARWKLLPHYEAAHHEAEEIVYVLSRNPKYGYSRRTNGRGTRYKGPLRFMDQFRDKRHAVAAVTKVILRDKYGEIPSTLALDEVAL